MCRGPSVVDVMQQLPPLPDAGGRSALQQPPRQARTQSLNFPSRAVRLNTFATLISVTPTGAVQCMILTDAVQRCGAPHKLLPCPAQGPNFSTGHVSGSAISQAEGAVRLSCSVFHSRGRGCCHTAFKTAQATPPSIRDLHICQVDVLVEVAM